MRALEKLGFAVVRQRKQIVMAKGTQVITIPRHDPVDSLTMGGIVKTLGLTIEEFKKLL